MKQGIIGKELIATGDQGKFRFALEFDKNSSILRTEDFRLRIREELPERLSRIFPDFRIKFPVL